VLILIFAAIVSAFVGEGSEAAIIGAIVLASCLLSFTQEYGASRAMEALKARIGRRASVLRDGAAASVAVEEIVPGDVVALSAGNLVPADGVLLAARDFNVSEATLTGETFPVVKAPGTSAPDAQIGQRGNAVFTGTSVRSGTATMLVARWNIAFVRRFMLTFGLVSSAFDFLTFGFLLFVLKATEATFQTGWFVESLVTQLAIVLVIRTRKAFWKSRPGRLLSWLTLVVALAAVAIPYLPGADLFGFVPPPAAAMAGIGVITALYLAASETAKRWFFSRQRRHRRRPFRR
jgi:magnesium-transporting ATPase (P-type)